MFLKICVVRYEVVAYSRQSSRWTQFPNFTIMEFSKFSRKIFSVTDEEYCTEEQWYSVV